MTDPSLIRPAALADLDAIVALWFGLMEHHRRLSEHF
jgi:hypothetical protein